MVVGAVALYLIQWRERDQLVKNYRIKKAKIKTRFQCDCTNSQKKTCKHTLSVYIHFDSFHFTPFASSHTTKPQRSTAQHSTTNRHKPRNRKNAHNKKMCNRHPIWIHSFSHEYLLYTLLVEYELVSVSPA